jgi:hypothetical protein
LVEVAGDKEEQRLSDGMIEQVKQTTPEGQPAAEPDRDGDQANMLDAGVASSR